MSEGPRKGHSPVGPTHNSVGLSGGANAQRSVEAFASRVLSLVAANSSAMRGGVRPQLLDDLIDMVMQPNREPNAELIARFQAEGIAKDAIVDRYLPAAARKLGAAWCEDEMSFAEVTIGSARLQALLRDLRAPHVTNIAAPSVLVLVPEDAYHTLGAGVLADQLRRLGASPQLAIGLPLTQVAELVETHDFNAVLVSAAASQRLETLRELVKCVRTASRSKCPIVIGGTVTEKDTDIRTLTGADYVSNNPEEALVACGLMIPTHGVTSPERRG